MLFWKDGLNSNCYHFPHLNKSVTDTYKNIWTKNCITSSFVTMCSKLVFQLFHYLYFHNIENFRIFFLDVFKVVCCKFGVRGNGLKLGTDSCLSSLQHVLVILVGHHNISTQGSRSGWRYRWNTKAATRCELEKLLK